MEESTFQAIYTGVYIVVFIVALTTTLYLFSGITTLAETTYEYGKVATGQSVIEAPSSEELNFTGSDVLSYYFNYVKKDKYEDVPSGISNVSFNSNTGANATNLSYSQMINRVKNQNYYLKVTSSDTFEINKK